MVTRDVNKLIQEGEKGVEKLYSIHIKYFELVDTWADRLTEGDILDEYELSQCMEQLTGALMKLGTVAGALEALKEEMEHNKEVKEFGALEKVKTQDTSIVKAMARDYVSKIRKWATDFRNYFYSAQSAVVTAQSRLKRLTVEKGAKKVDFTGETPVEQEPISSPFDNSSGHAPIDNIPSNTGDKNEW